MSDEAVAPSVAALATAEAYHANAVVFSFFRDGCCFPVLLIAAALIEKGCRCPRSGGDLPVGGGLGVAGGGQGVLAGGHGGQGVLVTGAPLVAAGYCMYAASTVLVFTLGDGVVGGGAQPGGVGDDHGEPAARERHRPLRRAARVAAAVHAGTVV